ncbi:MAG: isoprenylcysteine carboxylmethyltransferase family protein [Lysobacter sp.]|nr:MAG: isoprenylcysteine carboxylmethyltransferase family protein [Lysobacter sp.]
MSTPLDAKLPPPIVMLAACAAIGWVAYAYPETRIAFAFSTPIGIALIALGFALDLRPAIQFLRARTTLNPLRPAASAALVTDGIYRFTRNPMYLGQTLVSLGVWCVWSSVYGLIALPLQVAFLTLFQILPEERALSAKFGAEYDAYRSRVRRWL